MSAIIIVAGAMEPKKKPLDEGSHPGSESDTENGNIVPHVSQEELRLSNPLPRFGAKLDSIVGKNEQFHKRLDLIYRSKLRAFTRSRFCDAPLKWVFFFENWKCRQYTSNAIFLEETSLINEKTRETLEF